MSTPSFSFEKDKFKKQCLFQKSISSRIRFSWRSEKLSCIGFNVDSRNGNIICIARRKWFKNSNAFPQLSVFLCPRQTVCKNTSLSYLGRRGMNRLVWKKNSCKRLSEEKNFMQHKCKRKLMGKKGEKYSAHQIARKKNSWWPEISHPTPQELNGRPLKWT